MSKLSVCPRCGDRSLESLGDYAHCSSCLYYEDHWISPDHHMVKAMQDIEELEHKEIESEGDAEIQDCA